MGWIEPITDRNTEDLAQVKSFIIDGWSKLDINQKTKWLKGLKGSLNYIDLNRIENNCNFISNLYGGFPNMTFKLDWAVFDIIKETDVKRIVENVRRLRNFCKIRNNTPQVPELPLNTIDKLNKLEKILYDINFIYQNETLAFARDDIVYSSEIYCGDNIGDI